jgi:hypothetical protein
MDIDMTIDRRRSTPLKSPKQPFAHRDRGHDDNNVKHPVEKYVDHGQSFA